MAEKKAAPRTDKSGAESGSVDGGQTTQSFEQGLEQLETIVTEMEGGELPLERALDLFERGMKLSAVCRKQLAEAETRVEILTKRAGQMEPEPFATDPESY